jgi:lysophospholipase L1-like esterase
MVRRGLGFVLLALAACGGGGGGGEGGGPSGIGLQDLDADGSIYVIAFGDSITRGQGDGVRATHVPDVGTAGYPARFRSLAGVPVANFGVLGEQTSSGVRRLPSVVANNPADYVIILEGVNDILPERDVDTIGNLRTMVDAVFVSGAQPILGTLTPTCCNHAFSAPISRIEMLNAAIKQLAIDRAAELTAQTGVEVEIPVIDFFAAFIPPTDPPTPAAIDASSGLLFEEGLHPTPRGYDLMAATVFAAFFGEPPPTPAPAATPTP